MVTAEDADVGDNSRLTYSIESGDETKLFAISDNNGLITWSDLVNDSLSTCSWTLGVRVADNGPVKQLWTLVSLSVVIDNCVVDNVVHTASRQTSTDLRQLSVTDWHIFVIAVVIAACVVVVGCFLTVVVALRQCGRTGRRRETTTAVGDDVSEAKVAMMRLLTIAVARSGSDASSDSGCGTEQLMLVVDQHDSTSTSTQPYTQPDVAFVSGSLKRVLQHAHHRSLRLQVTTNVALSLLSSSSSS